MAHGKFGTAINCIDGRAQLPVKSWMKEKFRLDHIDIVTEPGPEKAILERGEDLKRKVLVSINAHGSGIVAIAGHHDCAANNVGKEEKVAQIKKTAGIVKSWGLSVEVVGLYVNEKWGVEVVG